MHLGKCWVINPQLLTDKYTAGHQSPYKHLNNLNPGYIICTELQSPAGGQRWEWPASWKHSTRQNGLPSMEEVSWRGLQRTIQWAHFHLQQNLNVILNRKFRKDLIRSYQTRTSQNARAISFLVCKASAEIIIVGWSLRIGSTCINLQT